MDPVTHLEEYKYVADKFLFTLPGASIQKIERVQNKTLWKRYYHHRKSQSSENPYLREDLLFHGTNDTKPEDIYKRSEGFSARFCINGILGTGNYFAMNSSYASKYALKAGGHAKILTAWVQTGNSTYLPPMKESTTITSLPHGIAFSITGGSLLYATYDRDLAYPAYIISFYKEQPTSLVL